jgi:hypothetical protein
MAAPSSSCPGVHVAINSVASYAAPRAHLLAALRAAGVPAQQVHVFLGGAQGDEAAYVEAESGVLHYRVRHNSVDFTAMVHIVENPERFRGVAQWFYLHDTVSVGAGFWSNATFWCGGLPACALPLTRWMPSSSMGLYDASFLNAHAADVVALKNVRNATAMRWKQRGMGWEDKLFKLCDATSRDGPIRRFTRRCQNTTLRRPTCICSLAQLDETLVRVYGAHSTPRQALRFPCADVVKFKANWARNRTLVIAP